MKHLQWSGRLVAATVVGLFAAACAGGTPPAESPRAATGEAYAEPTAEGPMAEQQPATETSAAPEQPTGEEFAMPEPRAAEESMPAVASDLVSVATNAQNFTTLVTALQAAGLVDTLKGPGPFTVFAPTDAAFAQLPAGTLASLMKPENHDQLVKILTYHVVPGRLMASQVATLGSAKTLQGGMLTIRSDAGGVTVNGAKVEATDITASNGVIHVIDRVLMPK